MFATRLLFFTTICALISATLFAGGISGTIKDTNGNVIPFATIYVKELGTGTTSNVEGN